MRARWARRASPCARPANSTARWRRRCARPDRSSWTCTSTRGPPLPPRAAMPGCCATARPAEPGKALGRALSLSRSGPGPGGEALAQFGDLVRAEAERGEHPVTPLVKTLGGLGEVAAGEPRVQPAG